MMVLEIFDLWVNGKRVLTLLYRCNSRVTVYIGECLDCTRRRILVALETDARDKPLVTVIPHGGVLPTYKLPGGRYGLQCGDVGGRLERRAGLHVPLRVSLEMQGWRLKLELGDERLEDIGMEREIIVGGARCRCRLVKVHYGDNVNTVELCFSTRDWVPSS